MLRACLALCLFFAVITCSSAADHTGVVVSVSPHANAVGESVLKSGGNAIDAAVAVGFALAVTWPEAGNIGGGGFMLVREPGPKSEPLVIDYRELAPKAATKDMLAKEKKAHLTVGVPGSVAGMHLAHQKFGKLAWKDLVTPAVKFAEEGFAIDAALAASLNSGLTAGKGFEELQRVFGKKEKWKAGDKLVQKDLAKTLSRIADKGPDGFYKGETAELIIKEMKSGGGLITADDLAAYQAKQRKAIHGTYRGHDIYGPPPPSSGGITLTLMLNILENYDLKKSPRYSPETLHLLTETMRRAYRERARHLGDGDFVKILANLTTKEFAKKLAGTIDLKKATKSEELAGDIQLADEKENTTHYSVVDSAGMAVSTTTTLENSFGCKVVVKGAGFLLNNEMTDFNPQPGVTNRKGQIGTEANIIAPGKRMLSSMTPTLVMKDGKVVLVTGSPGGRTIINTVLNVVVNVVDYEMSVREAVDAQRVHHQWFPDRLQVEAKLSKEHTATLKTLAELGHSVNVVRAQGDAHSIGWDAKAKKYVGAIDPRRQGVAVAFEKK